MAGINEEGNIRDAFARHEKLYKGESQKPDIDAQLAEYDEPWKRPFYSRYQDGRKATAPHASEDGNVADVMGPSTEKVGREVIGRIRIVDVQVFGPWPEFAPPQWERVCSIEV